MTLIIYQIFFILFFGISSKTIGIHGKINSYCKLENRTITFDICKIPPTLILPVCTGFCSSTTQWNFRSNRFITRTNSCKVTKHRTKYFVCPDSTHTAIEVIIPLECSCDRHHCYS